MGGFIACRKSEGLEGISTTANGSSHSKTLYIVFTKIVCVKRTAHILGCLGAAIAGVVYMKTIYDNRSSELSFVLGEAKVAPLSGHTIPRLELRAAVLATELYQTICKQINIKLDMVW